MYYLYIIQSIAKGRWYIGITENIPKRLQEHNAGKVKSTKSFRPYKLIYSEGYATKKEARQREIAVKRSGVIRKALKEKIHNMALSSNG